MSHGKNGSDRTSFHHGQTSDVDTESETIDDFSHSDKVSDKTDVRLSLDSRSETPVLNKSKSQENRKEIIKKTSDNHTHREENDNSEDVMVEISKKTTIKKIISRTTAVNGVTQATEVEEYVSQNTETNDRIHEMFSKSPKSPKVQNKNRSSNENDFDSRTENENKDLNNSTKPNEYHSSHRDTVLNLQDGSDSINDNKKKKKENEISDRIIKADHRNNLQSSKQKSDLSPKYGDLHKDNKYGSENKKSAQNLNDKIIRKVDENIVYKDIMPEKIIVINGGDNFEHLKINAERNPTLDDSINCNNYGSQNSKYKSDIIIDKYNNKSPDKYDKYKYHRDLPISSDFRDNPRHVADIEKERDYRNLDNEYLEKYPKNKRDYNNTRGNEKHDIQDPRYTNNESKFVRPISWNSNSLSNSRPVPKLPRSSTLNDNKIKWIDPLKSHHLKYDLKDNGRSMQNWIEQKKASLNRSDRNRRMKESIYNQRPKPNSQVSLSTRKSKNKCHNDINESTVHGNGKENSFRLRGSTSPQRQYEKTNEFQRSQPEMSFSKSYEKSNPRGSTSPQRQYEKANEFQRSQPEMSFSKSYEKSNPRGSASPQRQYEKTNEFQRSQPEISLSKSYEKPYFKSLTSLDNVQDVHRNTTELRPYKRKNDDLSLQVSNILTKFDLIKEELDKDSGKFTHHSLNDTDLDFCSRHRYHTCCCCCCNQMQKYTSLEGLDNLKLQSYQPLYALVPMSKSPYGSHLSIDSTNTKRKFQPSNSRTWFDNKSNRSFLNEMKKSNDPKKSRERIIYKY